ncbi:MAG: hypothetical protein J2P18_00125 [Nocardia sp.]|nr:hypothetical protein [Nocardia sp.]
MYLDSNALISPTAIVAKAASTYQTAFASLVAASIPGAFDLGDSDLQSAWRSFHSAWTSEISSVWKALDELAGLVPKSVHAMQNADATGGQAVNEVADPQLGALIPSHRGTAGAPSPGKDSARRPPGTAQGPVRAK